MSLEEKPWAIVCFNCECCSRFAASSKEAESLARADGWVLGIDSDSGSIDAVYACPECADLLDDTVSV